MPGFKTEVNGDLVFEQGTFGITADESESAKQNILFRLQTGLFDYDPEPELGAGLDEFIGRPNRADVGEAAKRAVVNSLIRDAAFPLNSISVEVVPLSQHVLGIYVFHQPRFTGVGSAVTVAVTFDLTVGLITLLDGETL